MPAGNFNTQTDPLIGYDSSPELPGGQLTTVYDVYPSSGVSLTQLDKTSSTTFANIPNLTVNVVAGGIYTLAASITGTATANGGAKFAIGGTATVSALTATAVNLNGTTSNARTTTTSTTLGTAIGASTAVLTNASITGSFTVATAGTITIQFAQNASHADTSSVYVGSTMTTLRVA